MADPIGRLPGDDGAPGARDATADAPADPATRIAELEADVDRLEDALRARTDALVEAREAARQARQDAADADRARVAAEARVARITGNPGYRIARRVVRSIRDGRRIVIDRIRNRSAGASRLAERQLVRRLVDQLPAPAPESGPKIAVVIVNRNGVNHLRRLLPSLEATAYQPFEVILVDNASTDDSVAFVREFPLSRPLRVIENDENRSFSDANNAAVAVTDAPLVLFLNNDVDPLEQHWLGWMVESIHGKDVVACGARLVIPRRSPTTSARSTQEDLELQHVGIRFGWVEGMPRPENVSGPDAADPDLLAVRDYQAATAACLLVRREAFAAVGGFDPVYVYGFEDVDLCLRLSARGGRIVVDGRAVLWHDESWTRRMDPSRETSRRQRGNRLALAARWGRTLFRKILLDRLDGGETWSVDPVRCYIVTSGEPRAGSGPSPAAIRTGLAGHGWSADVIDSSDLEESADSEILLVTDPRVDLRRLPRGAIKVAWIAGDPDPWLDGTLDEADVVLVLDSPAAERVRAASAKVAEPVPEASSGADVADAVASSVRRWVAGRRVGIHIQVDDWSGAETSGDYHVARALQRQLERRGLPTSVYFRPDWSRPVSTRDDVAIHLWGRYPLGRRPGQTTVLWILYHPELVTDELLADYDLLLAASDSFATGLAARSGRPVTSVHQATDPERFRPGQPGPAHDLLFVGNSRGVRRRILDDLTPTTHDLAVYGGGWTPELLDPAYLRGTWVSNADLPGYYGSAAIVLNDHWVEAANAGFLNNRAYDALAAGGFVISDDVDGLETEFDGGVVAYRTPAELLRLVDQYLADPAARLERAGRGRAAVLARHTFGHRVDEILGLLEAVPPPRPEALEAPALRPTEPGPTDRGERADG